jgi:hypothetical protein
MTLPKQWPIAAAVLGLLAVIGTGVKLSTSSNPLESHVDDLLARERQFSPNENFQERIDDLSKVQNDPGFTKLPAAKQRSVDEHLRALKITKSNRDFRKALDEIPNPRTAHTIRDLKEIYQRLNELRTGEALSDADAVLEAITRLEDAQILSEAAEQIRKQYSMILEAGNVVLRNKNEPNLPERIQRVFALAKDLKTPENDKDKPLPGSDRLTYAAVFQLAEVQSLLGEWRKLKEKLEPAAKSEKR